MTAPREGTSEDWWRDPALLQSEVKKHGGFMPCSRAHDGKPSDYTLRNWWTRHGLAPWENAYHAERRKHGRRTPGITTLPPPEEVEIDADSLDDIDGLLKERGLDPAEWVVVRVTINRWDGMAKNEAGEPLAIPLRQLKVSLRPRLSAQLVQPATVKPLPIAKFSRTKTLQRASKLVFVYGDDQRPNVDRQFEACKLAWLSANQPDLILDLGDGADAPTISGHKVNPAMSWPLQECVNDTASWLYAARCAAPNAEMVLLPDNHFAGRLRDYQMAQARALYGVHPADVDGLADDLQPLISVERMLRLDEIGVTYMAAPGDTNYAEGQYEIVPGELVAIHGYRTGQNLGKKFIDDYGCSVIYGHAHHQDVYVSDQNRRGVGRRRRLYALGVGCGANLHGGGGFAPGADWQNSALTVSVFPDGGWSWEPVNFEHGVLRWRDQEYRADLAIAAA
jgi:hypothetical protein